MWAAAVCYAIVLPGHNSDFRARLWPDCYREKPEIGPPAGGPISVLSRQHSPVKIRPGRPISGPEALLRNRIRMDPSNHRAELPGPCLGTLEPKNYGGTTVAKPPCIGPWSLAFLS